MLMVIVNANYDFIMIDIGTNGRVLEDGVYKILKLDIG